MKHIATLFAAAAMLFAQPAMAGNLNKLNKAINGLSCDMPVSSDWEFLGQYSFELTVHREYSDRNFFGNIDDTMLLVENGKLKEVAMWVDTELDDDKQRVKIVKYITKKLGQPLSAFPDNFYEWETDGGAQIFVKDMWPESGSIVGISCPGFSLD